MFKNKTFEGEVPKLTKWLYSSSGMFRDMAYNFVSMFLLMFAQYSGLGKVDDINEYIAMYSVITIIIVVLRIWDGFNDPIMGFIIEKCHFKSGKYRPWIFIGALTNSIVTFLMFWLGVHGWTYVIMFGVFYFLWDFTYTMNDISFWSVLPSLSDNEKVRANITTILSIFISIGSFIAGGLVPILSSNFGYTISYKAFSLFTSITFFLSQLILVIFMKERKRSEEVEHSSETMHFKDIFTVIFKNSQIRSSIIGVLLYYTGSTILIAMGLNYFYFNFGYTEAGNYQFQFTVVYAVSTFISQFLFPVLIHKFNIKQKTLFEVSCVVTCIGYLLLFGYVFLDPVEFFPLMCLLGFIIFFFQNFTCLILYIMIQDAIEYNEYKFNERRESAVFSLRAFTAKLASSAQQGVMYVFLLLGGLYGISQTISTAEAEAIAKYGEENVNKIAEEVAKIASSITGADNIELMSRVIFQIGFAIIPFILTLACHIVIRKSYKINETNHHIITYLNKKGDN